jgi:hypothetical protein
LHFAQVIAGTHDTPAEGRELLMTLVVILLVLWALGMATSYTPGGLAESRAHQPSPRLGWFMASSASASNR